MSWLKLRGIRLGMVGGSSSDDSTEDTSKNKGALILDATCTPADIKYPTDVSLLNEAREKLEDLITSLHSIFN